MHLRLQKTSEAVNRHPRVPQESSEGAAPELARTGSEDPGANGLPIFRDLLGSSVSVRFPSLCQTALSLLTLNRTGALYGEQRALPRLWGMCPLTNQLTSPFTVFSYLALVGHRCQSASLCRSRSQCSSVGTACLIC